MDFFLSRYFNCPNFITVAPETRDNEIYQSYEYAVMTSVLSEAWYPIEPFEWSLLSCLNLMLLASQIAHFADIKQFKTDSQTKILTLGKSRLTLLVCFYSLWAGKLFYWV